MQPTELHQVITTLVRWKLDEADTSRRLGLPRCVQTARREQERYAVACDTLRQAILLRNYEVLREPIRYTLDQLGLQVAEGSPDWQQIGHEAAHALLDATKEISRRDRGEFDQPSAYFRAAQHSTERVTDSTGDLERTLAADPEVLKVFAAPPSPVAEAQSQIQPPAVTFTAPPPRPRSADVETPAPRNEPTPAQTSTSPSRDRDAPPARSLAALPALSAKVQAKPTPETDLKVAAPRLEPAQACRSAAMSQLTAGMAMGFSAEERARFNADPGDPRTPFADIANAYLTERTSGKSGKRLHAMSRTSDRNAAEMANEASTVKFLNHFFGKKPIIEIRAKDLVEVFEVAMRLPNSYGRSNSEKRHPREIANQFVTKEAARLKLLEHKLKTTAIGKNDDGSEKFDSIGNTEEQLAAAETPMMAANTIYRKMQEAKRVFEFACMKRHILFNPMDEVIWTTAEHNKRVEQDGDRARLIWGDKLVGLFRTERFRTWSNGPDDALVWVVLLAVFTGARMEELLQLKLADFEWHDQILIMNIRNGANQHLKNKQSNRRVPIHPSLLKLGLVDLIEHQKTHGELRLFPDRKRIGNRDRLSTEFSEDFTNFRKESGLYVKKMDFHSFRKGANQRMLDLHVHREVREALLGHKDSSINGMHYTDGLPLDLLVSGLFTLDFQIGMLHNPFKVGDAAKVTSLTAARQNVRQIGS